MTQTANVRKLANDLAHSYQQGQKDALGELYPLLIPYMVHKARRSGAGDNAWDIAHDAFLRLAIRLSDKKIQFHLRMYWRMRQQQRTG